MLDTAFLFFHENKLKCGWNIAQQVYWKNIKRSISDIAGSHIKYMNYIKNNKNHIFLSFYFLHHPKKTKNGSFTP